MYETSITYFLDGVYAYNRGMVTEYNALTISVSRGLGRERELGVSRSMEVRDARERESRDLEKPRLESLVPFLSGVVLVAEEETYMIPSSLIETEFHKRAVKSLPFRPRGPELCRWLYRLVHERLQGWKLVSVSLIDNTGVKIKYRE